MKNEDFKILKEFEPIFTELSDKVRSSFPSFATGIESSFSQVSDKVRDSLSCFTTGIESSFPQVSDKVMSSFPSFTTIIVNVSSFEFCFEASEYYLRCEKMINETERC